MQSTPSYIAYLLTKYECVIVPGLGAFVVSGPEESKNRNGGLLCPPAKFLGFNPDIRHNDGLLANAIAKGENISYKEACLQISYYIDQITGRMEKQLPVQLAWIGKLELSTEHKLLFTPSQSLSCNADLFGMDNFYPLAVHEGADKEEYPAQQPDESPAPSSLIRRTIAIAATLLALFTVAIPVTDHSVQPTQMAKIIPIPAVVPPEAPKPVEEIKLYYIVIASLPTDTLAQAQIEIFRKKGLSPLGIIQVGNKRRIYVEKFDDKAAANTFLIRFRNENPSYSDAWLFIQKI
jgi:hypothetical protein